MGLFASFLDKYSCIKHDVTPGYTDNSGNFIPQSDIETAFTAHVSDVAIKDLAFIDPALIETGVRKLACESSIGIVPEDEITITEKDGSSSSWVVHEEIYASSFLKKYTGESRQTFLLRRLI